MSLTIAQIAATALNGAQVAIPDAVHVATLARTNLTEYDVDQGTYADTPTTWEGRAVFQGASPSPGPFPGYTIGSNEQVILLEGFSSVKKADMLTIGARTYTVQAVQDIGGAGSVFLVAAR